MNYEIVTIISAWASLAWFIWYSTKEIHKDMGDLRERMARLEGTMGVIKDLFQSSLSSRMQQGEK